MKSTFIKHWNSVRESYWAVPSLMVTAAIALSFLTTALDNALGSDWLQQTSWLYANQPEGARAVLSTVAGSMITVAGVTFSMTILSISYTTGQVGPHLLNNFMRDRSNQVTLGVFISTFTYCLMVLRTVRSADPAEAAESSLLATPAFVPHIAIVVALLMAMASVGVLIFYIHHIPESIHISNIVAVVGRKINGRLSEQFPACIGRPRSDLSTPDIEDHLPPDFYKAAQQVISPATGYVEYVDLHGLMRIACEHDLLIRLRFRPGDFVTHHDPLLFIAPREAVNDSLKKRVQQTFVIGAQQTETQNLRFLFSQLVEVAVRALSPGVNDPFTAMTCMDWLQSALVTCATRELPDAFRYDDQAQLRIVAEPETFTNFVTLVFDQLRPYVSRDPNAAIHMMEMLAKTCLALPEDSRRRLLLRHASRLRRECRRRQLDVHSLQQLTERHRTLIWLMRDSAYQEQVLRSKRWIGGRA